MKTPKICQMYMYQMYNTVTKIDCTDSRYSFPVKILKSCCIMIVTSDMSAEYQIENNTECKTILQNCLMMKKKLQG